MAATGELLNVIARAVLDALSPRRTGTARRSGSTPARRDENTAPGSYPGDFTGRAELVYAPHPGPLADPGEVVWTWVPYEEDHGKGKDRPVLVIGRDGRWLLALPMTSKDHDRDAAQEAREGRYWVEIGTGPWDSRGRVSEARVNRIVRVDPDQVRRISERVSPEVFELVAREVQRHW
nr:type II toxin-antitoxin system PemK/MazF family toxin [Propionicimonas sp.]